MKKTKKVYRCWSCDDLPIIAGEKLEHCRYLGHEIMVEPRSIDEIEDDNQEDRKNTAEEILEFAQKQIKKVIVSNNDSTRVYALLPVNSHLEIMELGSSRSISWLKILYYRETNKIHNDQMYHETINMIKKIAEFNEDTKRETVYKRIALKNSTLFYDLCSPDWKIVKICADSITTVSQDETTPLFERSKNQAQQVEPNLDFQGDPIEKFCKLLRMKDDLFKIHFVSLFIEGVPIPIKAMLGLQGSIKSTRSALIKRTVDPSGELMEDNLSHLPSKADDLNIHFANSYLAAFDNVSFITDDVSDHLCRAVTGASYPKRKLYTDQEETILKFKRKIVINGISFNIDRGDLAERTIVHFTQDIPPSERRSAKEVEKDFADLLPDLLGHIFVTIKKALSIHSEVKQEAFNLPRMADFAIWGEAISRALGNPKWKFTELYEESMAAENDILTEGQPLVPFLEEQLAQQNELIMPISAFLGLFKKFADDNHYDTQGWLFPKGPNKVRGFIERNRPLLREKGFTVSIFPNTEKNSFTKNATMVKMNRLSSLDSPRPLDSRIDFFTTAKGEHGEHGEHDISEYSEGE